MANTKIEGQIRAQVVVDAPPGVADIAFDLTPEQSVVLLQYALGGGTIRIDLKTPTRNGQVKEDPAAYAVE